MSDRRFAWPSARALKDVFGVCEVGDVIERVAVRVWYEWSDWLCVYGMSGATGCACMV